VLAQDAPAPNVSIHLAALQGNTEAVREHIMAGSDLNARDPYGSTALHASAFLCHTEIVEALLDAGANKYLRNDFGSTALESVRAGWRRGIP
jgi:ankyrin repeat protein